MKAKYALIFLAGGLCADVAGALFKILHWPFADWLLLAGLTLKVVGVVALLLKLLSHPKVKAFLNW